MKWILAAVLVGCGVETPPVESNPFDVTPPDCITTCGMRTYGAKETCAELNALESAATSAFRAWTAQQVCSALSGVILVVNTTVTTGIGGGYDPAQRMITVVNPDLTHGGQYIHEIAHPTDGDFTNPHFQWEERFISADINAFHETR